MGKTQTIGPDTRGNAWMFTQSQPDTEAWGGESNIGSSYSSGMSDPRTLGAKVDQSVSKGENVPTRDTYVSGPGQKLINPGTLTRSQGSNKGVGSVPRYHEQVFQTRETRLLGLDFVKLPEHSRNSLLRPDLSIMYSEKDMEVGPIRRAISRLL